MDKAAFQLLSQVVNYLRLKKGLTKTIVVTDNKGQQYEVTFKPIYRHDSVPFKEKPNWLW